MFKKVLSQLMLISLSILISSCALNKISVRLSSIFIEQKVEALQREKDLKKAQSQLPDNIAALESMLDVDKKNKKLHIYAAQANYSYAFAFIEDTDSGQATALYFKSFQHAKAALELHGIRAKDLQGKSPLLKKKLQRLNKEAVDALYWAALSWAKLIEIKQPNLLLFSQLHKSALLMDRVLRLDRSYQNGGALLFFAVYHGGRSRFLGGNDQLSGEYFEKARKHNKNQALMVDFLQAKYLNGRVGGQAKFTQRLLDIIKAPDDLNPELALMNAVAKKKAARLLSREQDWPLSAR